jgi:hypothetical protein
MRLKKRSLIGLLCLAIVLGVVVFHSWASGPDNGSAAIVGRITPSKETSPSEITYKRVSTSYYSLDLPVGWHRQASSSSNSSSLVTFNSGSNEATIAIIAAALPETGLDGVSDYIVRVDSPNEYSPIKSSLLPKNTFAFQSVDNGINDTLFMSNSQLYASISVTGTSSSQTLNILTRVSNSFYWIK